MRKPLLVGLLLIANFAIAANKPQDIPRVATRLFRTSGILDGGTGRPTYLAHLNVSLHPTQNFERWVWFFSDKATRKSGKFVPRFRVRFVPATSEADFPKVLFYFQNIRENLIARYRIEALTKVSRFVQRISMYPQIENGDMVAEFVLRKNTVFRSFQPLTPKNHLNVDLRSLSSQPTHRS